MKQEKIENASVLAFEKKLANSDAIMFSGQWNNRSQMNCWAPLKLQTKAIRGTISNRLKKALADDPAKIDAEVDKANLQEIDIAALPFDCDTLKISFTLRVLGNLPIPSVCNKPVYQKVLVSKINGYIEEHGFGALATRYAENIANGRFLWRKRVGAENIDVHVKRLEDDVSKS